MSPVFGFVAPFLARKGDGGMVETAVERRLSRNADLRFWGNAAYPCSSRQNPSASSTGRSVTENTIAGSFLDGFRCLCHAHGGR